MLPKISLLLRTGRSLALCLTLLLALGSSSLFQPWGSRTTMRPRDEAESAEALDATMDAAKPPLDLEAIAALEFGSYDTGWARYLNGMYWDQPLLHAEGVTQFPFRTVSLPGRVNMELLQDFDFLGALIEEYDLHIDEAALQGVCDTERMRKYQSSDVICVPGTSVMGAGLGHQRDVSPGDFRYRRADDHHRQYRRHRHAGR